MTTRQPRRRHPHERPLDDFLRSGAPCNRGEVTQPASSPLPGSLLETSRRLSTSAPLDDALADALRQRRADELVRPCRYDFAAELSARGSLFAHIANQASAEQEWFWSRFSAFATLHAGLLVFARVDTSGAIEWILSGAGLLLGATWVAVQSLSRSYVHRSKARLHAFEALFGLRQIESGTSLRPHSTDYGVWTARLVFLVWAITLGFALQRG